MAFLQRRHPLRAWAVKSSFAAMSRDRRNGDAQSRVEGQDRPREIRLATRPSDAAAKGKTTRTMGRRG